MEDTPRRLDTNDDNENSKLVDPDEIHPHQRPGS